MRKPATIHWEGTEDQEREARMTACRARRVQYGEDDCAEKDGSCTECTYDMAVALRVPVKAAHPLVPFRTGDPGKHIQTLVPTPEWKEIVKAADRLGVSLSLFLRVAARQHIAWLAACCSPFQMDDDHDRH